MARAGAAPSGAVAPVHRPSLRRNTPLGAAQSALAPSGENARAKTAPVTRSGASGDQLRPPLRERIRPRSLPISASWVARVDGDSKRSVEEQPDIGVEPDPAQVARAEQPAVGARVVRARAG